MEDKLASFNALQKERDEIMGEVYVRTNGRMDAFSKLTKQYTETNHNAVIRAQELIEKYKDTESK